MKCKTAAVALTLALSLAIPAAAAPTQEEAAKRQADLDVLYSTMEAHHPGLFTNTPESEFLARKAEIETRLGQVDDTTFALDLQSLAALAGDSHTTTNLSAALGSYSMIPAALEQFGGQWVLSRVDQQYAGYLGWAVTGVNGFSMDQVCQKLSALISADNQVKLRRQVRQLFGVEEIFTYCGLSQKGEPMVLTLQSAAGETAQLTLAPLSTADQAAWPELAQLTSLRTASAPTDYNKSKYYFALPLDDSTYYIQYNQCAQDPALPMEDFAAQVMAGLSQGSYDKVLLDLRNNGGGSDGVLVPLLMDLAPLVHSGELELWGLIGEATFSSAAINAMEILELGGHLAGEASSGSVDHFGSVGSFTLPNTGIRVGMSTKYISLAPLMESAIGLGVTPIQPDLAVDQALEDYLAGRDTVVEALKARTQPWTGAAQPDAPLTRGRFAQLLYQTAQKSGLDVRAQEQELDDLMPFAWYVPGVSWALSQGVSSGTGEHTFQAARPITRQEAAVMVYKTAALMGIGLSQQSQPADAEAAAPWALASIQAVAGEGWMELTDGAFHPGDTMTRAQGEALAACLSQN